MYYNMYYSMWSVWVSVTTLVLVFITHRVYRWRNPKCNGKLPPGSMGFPLIGETIQFFTTSKSLDIPTFFRKRMTKYGPLFKTSLVGRPVVISTDSETNLYIFQQGEKIVELWYMDSFDKLVFQDITMRKYMTIGYVHKYARNLIVKHIGPESIKERLLPLLDDSISQRIHAWSKLPSLEVKHAISALVCDFTAKLLVGYEMADGSGKSIGEAFTDFIQAGMMSVPFNIPGTALHKCLKHKKMVVDMIRKEMQERKANPGIRKTRDFLDHITEEMNKEKFLTEDLIVHITFIFLIASFETISSTLTLTVLLLTEHPSVVQELVEEHEAIQKSKGDTNSAVTWDEYKSMKFTHHVISESLRLGSIFPGVMRRAVIDIQINGYTIPKGWAIMIIPSAVQLNPENYDDPLVFNPWRWKHMPESVVVKKFMPFGGGATKCPGAEFSKVLMAIFLHRFVTKYGWTKLKGGDMARTPVLTFGDGFHIQVYEKE